MSQWLDKQKKGGTGGGGGAEDGEVALDVRHEHVQAKDILVGTKQYKQSLQLCFCYRLKLCK